MRTTSVNQFILETLQANPAHLTAQQVYEHIRVRLPSVNPSTVYRALERLAKAGLVSVSDIGAGAVVYESVGRDRHHHLVCQQCGAIETITDDAVQALFTRIEQSHDFQVATNHLILFGLCSQCRQDNATHSAQPELGKPVDET